ncbi:hypothetical protein BO70DRAFT_378642 [Aspergillus heteromorphus CBS 117.55]|uniref:Integral membrane protein n=1 Tax=Aspergillus heteromorphus CBS 117.55 TaxID=1448321 RepID=A0A317WKV5_9EURO|nr:uncharacterized protein BO70DRAFT_378642 [Aspergillus heteromorphus CBS 117.55]PWY85932.1 hypothetical protein BO70DRAFT_378642 [Aspergillus heteromorphus CBS 117.55]
MASPSRSLQASALSMACLSIGHTIGGRQWTSDPAFGVITGTKPWACGIVGWFQGSAFFMMTGLLHYQWASNPRLLQEPTNKAIAVIMNGLLWASSAWYFRHGIKENGWVVGFGAALQAWAVARAWLKY